MLKKIKNFLLIAHINALFDSFKQDTILIEFGNDILSYHDTLRKTINDFRDKLKSETGFILPVVHMKNNTELQENEFTVKIHDNIIYNEFIIPNKEKCIEEFKKVLKFIYDEHLSEIFTNESVEKYINFVQKENARLVCDLSYKLTTSEIKIVLEDLLRNGKNLNNITYIFEKISETIYVDKLFENSINPHQLSEEIAGLL